MALWKWKALDFEGKAHRGVWEDRFPAGVVFNLRRQDLYPVSIRRSILSSWKARFTVREKLYWARTCRKIGTLLEAGLPLLSILEMLTEKETSPLRKTYWQRVRQHILAGNDLSAGLANFHPRPGFFLESMIKAGEKSGTLAESVLECAVQLEEEYFWEQKIKTALFYPLLLMVTALAVVYSLSVFVLPVYEQLFKGFDAELSYLTRLVFRAGSGIPYLTALAILGLMLSKLFHPQARIGIFPGSGQIRRYRLLVNFCLLWGRLLHAGIPLLESLTLLYKLAGDTELAKIIGQLEAAVQQGKKISPVILKSDFFPPETGKMLEAAEESGKLSEMLKQLGCLFQQELEEKIKRFTRWLEPVLILGMAGLVGLIALAVMLPIFDLSIAIQ